MRKISKKELLIVLVLLGLSLLLLAVPKGRGDTASVSINGSEVLSLSLSDTQDSVIDLSGSYGVNVQLEVKAHAIRFLSSDCPDHLCMGYGFIDHEPQSAVCLPNRVAIVLRH